MNSFGISAALFTLGAFLSAFSQILLKKSANQERKSIIKEFLNWRVILSYSIYILVTIINIIAFRGVDFKYGPVLGATTYIFFFILARVYLKEEISKKKGMGAALIIIGIVIFSCF